MKIAVNTRFLLPGTHLEGVGRYTYEILSRLCAQHPEHTFYFFFDRDYDKKYLFAPNVKPMVISPQARHPLLFVLWFEWSLRRALQKIQPDVFLSFDAMLSLTAKTKSVLVVHDLAYLHFPGYLPKAALWFYQFFMPRYIKKADWIVSVSSFTAHDIVSAFGISKDKISIAYNAMPSNFKKPINENNRPIQRPYFIVPGAISARKNTLNVLLAFEKFLSLHPESNIQLVFAGGFMFPPKGKVSQKWNELIKSGAIVHVDKPNDATMAQWMQHAEALFYVSLFEGFGIPILEGMGIGVPVVTSNSSSMPEVAGDAALCVDPHQPDQIVLAMEAMLDAETQNKYIQLGKERLQKFDWSQSAEVIMQALLRVAAK